MKHNSRRGKILRYGGATLAAFAAAALLVVFVVGDFGATQYWLNGVEALALRHRATLSDRLGLSSPLSPLSYSALSCCKRRRPASPAGGRALG